MFIGLLGHFYTVFVTDNYRKIFDSQKSIIRAAEIISHYSLNRKENDRISSPGRAYCYAMKSLYS
jgi:hypothetical protein